MQSGSPYNINRTPPQLGNPGSNVPFIARDLAAQGFRARLGGGLGTARAGLRAGAAAVGRRAAAMSTTARVVLVVIIVFVIACIIGVVFLVNALNKPQVEETTPEGTTPEPEADAVVDPPSLAQQQQQPEQAAEEQPVKNEQVQQQVPTSNRGGVFDKTQQQVISVKPVATESKQVGVEVKTAASGDSAAAKKLKQEQHDEIKADNVAAFQAEVKKANNPYNIYKGRMCFGDAYDVKIDLGNASIDGCKSRCTSLAAGCDGFTFNLRQNRCWLWKNKKFTNANTCKGDGKYQVFAKKVKSM